MLGILALGLMAAAWSGRAADEPAVVFAVRTAGGETLRGPLWQLGADWSVAVGRAGGRRVAGNDVVSVRRTDVPLPAFPAGAQLFLHGGDRVAVHEVGVDGERVLFHHPDLNGGEESSLPLSGVALYWLAAPGNVEDPEALGRRLLREKRAGDQVLMRNGDVLEGVLGGLDGKKLTIEVSRKKSAVDLDKVAVVAMSTELAEPLAPKGAFARVTLLGEEGRGTRLSLKSAKCSDGATLEGETAFGARLRVPLEQVAGLDVLHGRAVYLSDLKPSRYEHQPYLDAGWPFVADGSVAGGDLRLAGGVFDKGLGLHSRSRLTFALAEPYRRFEALVGLDDKSGGRGRARVRVLADGKPLDLGADRELTGKGEPLAVSVPVKGVRELTLEVDFGSGGDVGDHVNWADARLVK